MLIKITDDSEAFAKQVEQLKVITREQYASKAAKHAVTHYEDILQDRDNKQAIIIEKNLEISELKGQVAQKANELEEIRTLLKRLSDFTKG